MNVYVWNRLPSTYQEVEYITFPVGNDGNTAAFIVTWITPANNIQIETKVEVITTEQNHPIFWIFTPTEAQQNNIWYPQLTPYQNSFYYGYWGTQYNAGSYSATVGNQYTIVYNDSSSRILVNGSSIATLGTVVAPSWWWTISIWVRGSLNWGRYWQYKYFYFRIYDKTTQQYVWEFIPCYRKSDNEVWMYDIVTNQFYPKYLTGATYDFTKGNNVTTLNELQNAYIGEVYNYEYDFRGKTSSQVTSDWWTLWSWLSFDSNWAYSSTWSSTTKAIWYALSNAKRITMTAWIYNANSWNLSYMLWNNKNTSTNQTGYYMSWYDGGNSQILVNGTIIEQYAQSEPSWQSEYNYTLDFENLTYKFEYAGITKSWAITQAQATSIKNNLTYFRFAIQHSSRLQYIKLTVE